VLLFSGEQMNKYTQPIQNNNFQMTIFDHIDNAQKYMLLSFGDLLNFGDLLKL
jgi:hypothetical protein